MNYGRYITALAVLTLSACSSGTVKDTLGLNRSAPDEFRVVSRPPLSVPPQFTLRPPVASDVMADQDSASRKAKSLVLGGKQPVDADAGSVDTSVTPVEVVSPHSRKGKATAQSSADTEFLKQAGASKANPKVRDELVEERYTIQDKKENGSWWDVFSASSQKKDPLVDASKESERIKKTEDAGQPVTAGQTPEVKAKDSGLLGRIFGD